MNSSSGYRGLGGGNQVPSAEIPHRETSQPRQEKRISYLELSLPDPPWTRWPRAGAVKSLRVSFFNVSLRVFVGAAVFEFRSVFFAMDALPSPGLVNAFALDL